MDDAIDARNTLDSNDRHGRIIESKSTYLDVLCSGQIVTRVTSTPLPRAPRSGCSFRAAVFWDVNRARFDRIQGRPVFPERAEFSRGLRSRSGTFPPRINPIPSSTLDAGECAPPPLVPTTRPRTPLHTRTARLRVPPTRAEARGRRSDLTKSIHRPRNGRRPSKRPLPSRGELEGGG